MAPAVAPAGARHPRHDGDVARVAGGGDVAGILAQRLGPGLGPGPALPAAAAAPAPGPASDPRPPRIRAVRATSD